MRESMEVLFMNQFKCLNYKPIKTNNTMERTKELIKEIQSYYFIINKELFRNEARKESYLTLLCFSKYAQPDMIQTFTFTVYLVGEKGERAFKRIKIMSEDEIQLAIGSLVYMNSINSKISPMKMNGITYRSVLSEFLLVHKKSDCKFKPSDFTNNFLSLIERKDISDIKVSIEKILYYLDLYLEEEYIRYYVNGESVLYEVFYTENINQLK